MREHAPKRHHAQKEWTVSHGRLSGLTRESDPGPHPDRPWPDAEVAEARPGHDFSRIPLHAKVAPGVTRQGPMNTRAGGRAILRHPG
jgi:hypothetical protein